MGTKLIRNYILVLASLREGEGRSSGASTCHIVPRAQVPALGTAEGVCEGLSRKLARCSGFGGATRYLSFIMDSEYLVI